MKIKALRLRTFFLITSILFLVPVSILIGCGENGKETTAKANEALVKTEAVPPTTGTSNEAAIPENKDTAGKNMVADPQKKILQENKKTGVEPTKKTSAQQPVVINSAPVQTKPVSPVNVPPVVKPTEPLKPIQETKPVPVEIPKPVVPVVKPQPEQAEQSNWVVPAKYKNMTSPTASNKESIELGKSLYGTHCKSCHGSKGDGNGTKAASMDTKVTSFLSSAFRAQQPGEVYYKSIFGRKDMPKFDKKIPDEEERWALVDYIMSFKN